LNLEPLLDAVEAMRREVAKSYRRLQWADVEAEEWAKGNFRDRILNAIEQSGGEPRRFLENVAQLKGMRQERRSACEDWLNTNGYLLDPPTLGELTQIGISRMPHGYPNVASIAQGLALIFRAYAER
jgi:hypothetical protein